MLESTDSKLNEMLPVISKSNCLVTKALFEDSFVYTLFQPTNNLPTKEFSVQSPTNLRESLGYY